MLIAVYSLLSHKFVAMVLMDLTRIPIPNPIYAEQVTYYLKQCQSALYIADLRLWLIERVLRIKRWKRPAYGVATVVGKFVTVVEVSSRQSSISRSRSSRFVLTHK